MVGTKRKELEASLTNKGYRECPDCKDQIPYYTRICPFCHYTNAEDEEGQYDHSSSPALMFRDLVSYSKLIVNLEPLSFAGGVARWFALRDIDPQRVEFMELESTFWVIYDLLINGLFGDDERLAKSANAVREIVEEVIAERAKSKRAIVWISRAIALSLAMLICGAIALVVVCCG